MLVKHPGDLGLRQSSGALTLGLEVQEARARVAFTKTWVKAVEDYRTPRRFATTDATA